MHLKNYELNPAPALLVVISCVLISGCGSSSTSPDTENPATLVFDELTDSDISSDRNNPTPLQLQVMQAAVAGSMVSPDRDYLTINVPASAQLDSLTLTGYESTATVSFIGLQAGSVFTEPHNTAQIPNLLGYAHFGSANMNADILPLLAEGQGAQGFTPPLAAGDYTFWIQETGDTPVNYELTFSVSSTTP